MCSAQFISVMGIKDQVGASTFAYQLAWALKKSGKSVLLLDADVPHLGDLRLLSDERIVWRGLKDLQKLPCPIQPAVLNGFLSGPQNIASIAFAKDRLSLKDQNFAEDLQALDSILPFFEVVIADAGSRWDGLNVSLLKKSDLLLFLLNAEMTLVEEARRKLEELSRSYFPSKRIGWVGWRWDSKSFLTPSTINEALSISHFGNSVEMVLQKLEGLADKNGDLHAFIPETLIFEKQQAAVIQEPCLAMPSDETVALKITILHAVKERMELKGLKAEINEEGIRSKTQKIVLEILDEKNERIPPSLDRTLLVEEVLDELLGLGPLETLLKATHFNEILVNGLKPIYVEEKGRLRETPFRFLNIDSLQKTIERILLPLGRRIDESSPMVDGRLSCGSRVNIIVPPLALDGPVISIRRFSKRELTPQSLIDLESVRAEEMAFLEKAVHEKLNILVSGGTGSGKTTLLNILSSFIPAEERIITIEDAAELFLNQPHVVRLETRPSNIEGKGGVTIRDLVRNALRMRPDRIVVGECRGAEALDMLSAMNTGHDGSLTTLHANSPRDALSRLETLVMFAGLDLPSKAIREQIAGAIDVIIQIARLKTGKRKIVSIAKLSGLEGETFTLETLFEEASYETIF